MAQVLSRSHNEARVAVTVPVRGGVMEMETAIRKAVNAVGCCVTEEAISRFDTDGSPSRVGALKLSARGRDPKAH